MMTGKQLTLIMHELELRQLDLAELFERTTRQVRRWQNGETIVPVEVSIILRLMDWGIVDRMVVNDAKTKTKR